MTPNLGIFAINLDRSPDRWSAVRDRFGSLPWPLHRVAALDGLNATADVLAFRGQELVSRDGIGWSYPRLRMVSITEEACFCSHLVALRKFLESEHEFALVIEDDARPLANIEIAVINVAANLQGLQIAKLSGGLRSGSRLAVEYARFGGYRLVRSLRPSSNAAAYIVTRDSAEQLLKAAGKLLAPYDDYLSAPALHGCEMLHLSPWIVTNKNQLTPLPSTINPARDAARDAVKRSPYHYAVQAYRRSYLRFQLWADALRGLELGRLTLARWSPDNLTS